MSRLFAIILICLVFLQGCVPLAQAMVKVATIHLNKGLDYAADGQYTLALDEYQQAIDLLPTTLVIAYAHSLRAAIYSQLGAYAQALQEANAALDTDSTIATSFISRGYVYLDLKQWQAAIADFDQAITMDQALYQAHLGRAVANVNLKHIDLAVADYRAALTLAPNQPGVDQINNMIATLENLAREQLPTAATPVPTLSELCNWFNASQRLRNARISGSTKFFAFYDRFGTDEIALADPIVRQELLAALEEYLPYEREFIAAWQQLGSIPRAAEVWSTELAAEQQKLAANQKMVQGIQMNDDALLVSGAEELEAATEVSDRAVAGMLELRQQCLAELR